MDRLFLHGFPFVFLQIKTSVIWATPNVSFSIPLWVIILAILLGLLVLAILTVVMWKVRGSKSFCLEQGFLYKSWPVNSLGIGILKNIGKLYLEYKSM